MPSGFCCSAENFRSCNIGNSEIVSTCVSQCLFKARLISNCFNKKIAALNQATSGFWSMRVAREPASVFDSQNEIRDGLRSVVDRMVGDSGEDSSARRGAFDNGFTVDGALFLVAQNDLDFDPCAARKCAEQNSNGSVHPFDVADVAVHHEIDSIGDFSLTNVDSTKSARSA